VALWPVLAVDGAAQLADEVIHRKLAVTFSWRPEIQISQFAGVGFICVLRLAIWSVEALFHFGDKAVTSCCSDFALPCSTQSTAQ